MRLILTLYTTLFLVSGDICSATEPVEISYPITQKNIKISTYSYTKYMQPQLRNILSEFYDILIMEEKEFRNFIRVRKSLKKMYIRIKNLGTQCQKSVSLCKENLAQIQSQLQPLESEMFKIEKKFTQIKAKTEEDEQVEGKASDFKKLWEISQRAKSRQDIQALSADLGQMLNTINVIHLQLGQNKVDTSSVERLQKESRMLPEKVNFMIWKMLPIHKQEIYRAVWVNYFQRIEKFTLQSTDPTYLKQNLESLNFNWNLFHLQMEKGNLKSKKRVVSMIRQIHRRWNSILKIILG